MQFNLYIRTSLGIYNILDINEKELGKVVKAYKYGLELFFLKGKRYLFETLYEIQIFTFESDKMKNGFELYEICKQQNLLEYGPLNIDIWIPVNVLVKNGKRVTDEYIKDDFGYLKDARIDANSYETFVDVNRIDEIEGIEKSNLDFTKLIAFLKELNVAYANRLFLTIPLLIRSIIDHVPPCFSKVNFSDVSGSHGTKSFKESMINLDKSSRKIADSFLHTHIRTKEVLPNETQINFRPDLDVLLQEIVRINKK